MQITLGQQYNGGEKPTVILYLKKNQNARRPSEHPLVMGKKCTFTLIAMQGHQKNIENKPETM